MKDLLVGWTTFADVETARRFAHELIELNLASCVQIDELVQSIYRYEGGVHDDVECRLWVKFKATFLEALEAFIAENQPYDTPQWIVVKPDFVSEKYLDWATGR